MPVTNTTVCPGCGEQKSLKAALCHACFLRVPLALREAFYRAIGKAEKRGALKALLHAARAAKEIA